MMGNPIGVTTNVAIEISNATSETSYAILKNYDALYGSPNPIDKTPMHLNNNARLQRVLISSTKAEEVKLSLLKLPMAVIGSIKKQIKISLE